VSAPTVNRMIISVIVGIVVWLIFGYFLHWLPGGKLISLLLSVVGAIVFTEVANIVAGSMRTTVSSFAQPLIAAAGSAAVLYVGSLLIVSSVVVQINCTPGSASANPDPAKVQLGGTVKWTASSTSFRSYTIHFKDQSPFDGVTPGTQLKDIPSNPTTGETPPNTTKRTGRFEYGFTCSNGPVVDPMIDVWK
jgi:hypothetical protein